MLKKEFQTFLHSLNEQSNPVILLPIEKQYAIEHQLLEEADIHVTEDASRFVDLYAETVNKETDDVITENNRTIMEKEISYFKEHLAEYIYIESNAFDIVRIDALSIEVDSVFRTYEVMFGLRYPKKEEEAIRSFFNENLSGENHKYTIMFNSDDGLWDINLNMEHLKGFSENNKLSQILTLIYTFLFQLAAEKEKK